MLVADPVDRNPELPRLSIQVRPLNAERLRRFRYLPAVILKDGGDVVALEPQSGPRAGCPMEGTPSSTDRVAATAAPARSARPRRPSGHSTRWMTPRSSARLPAHGSALITASAALVNLPSGAAMLFLILLHQSADERRNVFRAIAQRRQIDSRRCDPAVEIRAEAMLAHVTFDGRRRAGHQPDVGGDRLPVEEHLAVPGQTRQPPLDRRGKFRDILQEQRSAPGRRDSGCPA